MDAYLHLAKKMEMSEKETIEISLVHQEGEKKTKLQTINIVGRQTYSFDFNAIFKQISSAYKKVFIEITNNG